MFRDRNLLYPVIKMEFRLPFPLLFDGECPFSWDLSEDLLKLDFVDDYDDDDGKEFYPLILLMYEIMNIYVKTKKEDSNLESILNNIDKCDDNMSYLEEQEHPQISLPTAVHIFQATQAYVFHKFGLYEKLDELWTDFKFIDLQDYKSRSTLEACKSIAVTKKGARESIAFIRKAIQENPDCDLWYHILGKELRRIRCDENGEFDNEERKSFEKSYHLSEHNLYFGVCLAQMYLECDRISEAHNMYHKIFNSINLNSPVCNKRLLLELALGFIKMKKFTKAKLCLTKASERLPETCSLYKLYSHYEGLYHVQKKNYGRALPHLERALTETNLEVEKDYLSCRSNLQGGRFNTTEYLQYMLKKYENLPNPQKICLHVELALSYWQKDKNYKQALRSFLDAFELDPTSRIFKKYTPLCVNVWITYNNIILTLKELLTPDFYTRCRCIDDEIFNMVDKLQHYL